MSWKALSEGEHTKESSVVDATESVPSVRGNLEGINDGIISGWVFNEASPLDRLKVNIIVDDLIAQVANAELYREDLEAAGIGDGRCAFSIPLDDIYCDGLIHKITVEEKSSSFIVGTVECRIPTYASTEITKIYGDELHSVITFARDISEDFIVAELLLDVKVILEHQVVVNPECHEYHIVLNIPAYTFDDNFHLLSIRVKDKPTSSLPEYKRLGSITTGWEHIRKSYASMNLSAVSKLSAYRYRALQSHIRNISHGDQRDSDALIEQLINVQKAHDSLVEGIFSDKSYSKLTLPKVDNPVVSVIVPVHNAFNYTHNCIASLVLAYNKTPFEVIIVDDVSNDETVEISSYVDNIKIVKNQKNLGFLRSAEAGAAESKGDYIVFLNNDTEVTDGWLDELLESFIRFDQVGLVGAKLIYPDGALQEAGGGISSSGQPWNIGNRENPENPRYNYVRQADYLSGAAMMISQDVWSQVNGFSEEFTPAYYEDTDLAFKVRDLGYKTLYSPHAVVVHYEGMSNGRDLDEGYKRFQSVNAPTFRSKWRHVYRSHGDLNADASSHFDRDKDFKVLMIDHTTPTPDQDAGSFAAINEMRLLQELGCKITFVPNNMAHMGRYTTSLQKDGVECLYAPFYTSVGAVLKERGKEFDLVYITRYDVAEQVLKYVNEYSKAKVVLNNADLHFLREMRAAAFTSDSSLANAKITRMRELEVIDQVDAVLSYNEVEHTIISSHTFENKKIFKCPWVLHGKDQKIPFSEREGIAFLGGYNHFPNREAVIFFVDEVMPLIRSACPEIKFHIYGSAVPEEIRLLQSESVIVEGFIESLDTLFNKHKVFIAPLLSGAGIKGKVLESVSYQVPCVLSPIAAESTGLVHNLSTMIAQDPNEWLQAIKEVYYDEAIWESLSREAYKLVDERYSQTEGLRLMSELLSFLSLDPSIKPSKVFST